MTQKLTAKPPKNHSEKIRVILPAKVKSPDDKLKADCTTHAKMPI